MKYVSVFILAIWLPFFLHAKPAEYTFIADGEMIEPLFLTTEGKTPITGDVAILGIEAGICLDEPGLYRLETTENSLWRIDEDGKKHLIACEIKGDNNPLATLDDEALKHLRGVILLEWPPAIVKQLARLDLTRVCITLSPESSTSDKTDVLPQLPASTTMLILGANCNWDKHEPFANLKKLKKLRFFEMQGRHLESFDFSILIELPLEYLGLPYLESTDTNTTATLEKLTTLKTLNAGYCNYIGDGAWLARLKNLRQLDVSGFTIVINNNELKVVPLNLAGLSELPHLTILQATGQHLQSLPAKKMPALQFANFLLCKTQKEMIEAFAKTNPQAEVHIDMNAALQKKLTKADRLRVRSDGTCHRDKKEEKTLYETRDSAEIAKVLRDLVVDESRSGDHCLCCGTPTLEFYVGEKLIGMVGVHHGLSLRWADSPWPGDGVLTKESVEALDDWLTKCGVWLPKDERNKPKTKK